jgi:hypothetical protein
MVFRKEFRTGFEIAKEHSLNLAGGGEKRRKQWKRKSKRQ